MAHEEVGLVVSDPEQVILESDPYRRLAYTWHPFTPEWAAEVGMDEATADAWRAEPRSKVAFDIEDIGQGVVKLTVVQTASSPVARSSGHLGRLARRPVQSEDPSRDRLGLAWVVGSATRTRSRHSSVGSRIQCHCGPRRSLWLPVL